MNQATGKISASMMCADLINLKETIQLFEQCGIEYLHIDVMDGNFVPNFGLGIDYIRGLREMTCIPIDLHLMVEHPEEKLDWFDIQPKDSVSIHFESTVHIQRALERIHAYGCQVMLAINPATPIYSIEEVLEYIDGINLLTVNPGFAGQKIVHSCIKKTERLKNYIISSGFSKIKIEVDGNINYENAKILRQNGADIFVAGTSSIFSGTKEQMKENIRKLRNAILLT